MAIYKLFFYYFAGWICRNIGEYVHDKPFNSIMEILISEKIILFNNNMKLLQEKLAKYDAPQKLWQQGSILTSE